MKEISFFMQVFKTVILELIIEYIYNNLLSLIPGRYVS